MGIEEDQITKSSVTLTDFSGETKQTLGYIHLPTSATGVNSYEKFSVIDCLSSYNILLGRPWIHNLGAVPSTCHQCVKFPSSAGVQTIQGSPRAAQECYKHVLKPGPGHGKK